MQGEALILRDRGYDMPAVSLRNSLSAIVSKDEGGLTDAGD